MARYAILIGSSRYPEEPGLDELRCPEHDVDTLAAVLGDPERGGFEQVETLKNAPHYEILARIHQLLVEAGRDHLALIYFSGHGVLDDAGQLYLATLETNKRLLATSAVAVNRIRELVDQTGNRRAVLILDCCHAGAVGQGFKGETTEASLQQAAGVGEEPGRGMYILAASTAIQTAKEKETDDNGLYTKHLVAGLTTGNADLNGDGWVGVDELHGYVRKQVLAERPVQEPRFWGLDVGDPPVIAKSGRKPRKEREQQVRKRLFDLARDGHIPDDLLDQAKFIAGKPVDALTPLEQRLDPLLDALIKKELAPGEFIRDWYDTNRTAENASASPSPSISEFYQRLLLAKTREDFQRLGYEIDQYLENHPNDPDAWMLKGRIANVIAEPAATQRAPKTAPKQTAQPFGWWIALLVLLGVAIGIAWYWWSPENNGTRPGLDIPQKPEQESVTQSVTSRPPHPVGSTFRDSLKDGGEGPEMVMIPAGELLMGSPETEGGRDNDERQHAVTIEQPFAIGKYEVTVGEFRQFVEATDYRTEAERNVRETGCWAWSETKEGGNRWAWRAGRTWLDPGFSQGDDHPVVCVSWNDAVAYIDWLNDQTGERYRLPTEAEWEYAARAGTTTARFWDDDPNQACEYANVADQTPNPSENVNWTDPHECKDGYFFTASVGQFQANAWGLYDVLGNVWEWTCSEYDEDYGGAKTDCAARDSTTRRAVRGGSWDDFPHRVRSAVRFGLTPGGRNVARGFRLARSP